MDHVTVSTRTWCNARVLTPDGTTEDKSYQLIEEIGRGAAATVWRGRDRASGREVAVKVLHEEHMGHPRAIARFMQERSILLSVRHPNVVRVRDLLTTGDGALALVMDLVQGGNLRTYLEQRGTIPTAAAATLLAQVADGLDAAHARGVVHRDLKPDNVLVDRDLGGRPRARLTDFGIARVLDAPGMTTSGSVVGTPNYMSPELIEGGRPSPAVDVYALGMMFYELVVGRPPYAGQVQTAILIRHLDAAPRRRAGIPKQAWTLIQSCVDRDPSRRPSAAELAVALRRVASGTADVPALPILREEIERPSARSRRSFLAGSIGAVILVALALVGFAGRHVLDGDRATRQAASGRGVLDMRPPGAVLSTGGAPTGAGAEASAAAAESIHGRGGARKGPAPIEGTRLPATPEPVVYGAWHCPPDEWTIGSPAQVRPCHATGPALRIMGTVKAAPGVAVDMTVAIRDAETDAEASTPYTCAGLATSAALPERTCGPFEVSPPRGHTYVVVVNWVYAGLVVRAGVVRGDPVTW
jgi:serine/threonine-protein kinase